MCDEFSRGWKRRRKEEGIFQKRKRSFSPYNRCGPFARFIKTKCELGFFPLGVQTCNGFPAYVNCVLCNFRIKCCLVLEQSALVQCNLCIISIPIRSHSSCFLSLSQCCAERPFSEQDKGERREKRKKRPTVWKPKKEIQSATSYFLKKVHVLQLMLEVQISLKVTRKNIFLELCTCSLS